ncbi:aminoglycoside phosphotransferase family protein [Streptomyces sp. NPDC051776]|uniref:aminoglycoside phosphotransferase family protein n=1 Tax=Streptomyces sp. NPDC051776 TaxID=3155414 RepID=UPI00341E45ED
MRTPTAEELRQFAGLGHVTMARPAVQPGPGVANAPASAATIPHPLPTPEPVVLADRPDGTVVRIGDIVSKAHAPGIDPTALTARLHVAAHPRLHGVLLPPLPVSRDGGLLGRLHDGRAASLWPSGRPVAPDDPAAAPWEEAAVLLARLHSTPLAELALPGSVPPMCGPAKAARAMARLRVASVSPAARDAVEGAWHGLPPWARDEAPAGAAAAPHAGCVGNARIDLAAVDRDAVDSGVDPAEVAVAAHGAAVDPAAVDRGALCHGDWHLGQLVRHPDPDGPWLLIDVDDLGLGDPAWDLARPAAWFAAGLLAPDVWQRFLDAYRSAGGPAVRSEGDPWPQLDVPARALTVQTAALALVRAAAEGRVPDEDEMALVEACARIADLGSGGMSQCVMT